MVKTFFQQVRESGAVDDRPEVKQAMDKCESPKQLVEMLILDEISNVHDAQPEVILNAIERYLRAAGGMNGRKKVEVTQKACLFVVYQTQRQGSQNGYRLCLVTKGVKLEEAVPHLRGDVAEDACEVVVVSP